MVTQQAQVKITLPLALKEFLESKAFKFDMPISSYIRHLILKDVEDLEYPVFQVSDKTVKKAKEAVKNKDKSILVGDVDKFFKNL